MRMAEYLEREAIMKFPIRKDRCDKEHANEHFIFGIESVLEYVENLPAADVAPVVYCRECKRSGLTEFGKRYCSEPMGAFEGCIPVEDNSFCSGGKRREDAHAQD